MNIKNIFIVVGALCCALTMSAFAETTQGEASTAAPGTTPATAKIATPADPSLVSSNSSVKQYSGGDNCFRKVCKRSDFGEVTCHCPKSKDTGYDAH